MQDARDAVLNLQTIPKGQDDSTGQIVIDRLRKLPDADPAAAAVLQNVMSIEAREQSSIISTAARALQVYQLPGAIRSTEEPNFDPAAFVRGDWGYSTVYIMSSNEQQDITAPLVIALLNEIRQEQYKLARSYAHDQMSMRVTGPPPTPTMFALDEMYGIAPIPDLPNMLSEGGSQGVVVLGAIQDLALVGDRWNKAGESFLTMFGDVLVFPAIRHKETLEAVSVLCGEYDAKTPTTSYTVRPPSPTGLLPAIAALGGAGSGSPGGTDVTYGTHISRQRIVPPDVVARGVNEWMPEMVIHLSGQGPGTLFVSPYWREDPWPQVLTSCMQHAFQNPTPVRRAGDNPFTSLPVPDLSTWARQNESYSPWAKRYLQLVDRWPRY